MVLPDLTINLHLSPSSSSSSSSQAAFQARISISLRAFYAMSGTDIAYADISLCTCYAMSGTDLAGKQTARVWDRRLQFREGRSNRQYTTGGRDFHLEGGPNPGLIWAGARRGELCAHCVHTVNDI
eukprot:289944-Rhodomonas_salina.1